MLDEVWVKIYEPKTLTIGLINGECLHYDCPETWPLSIQQRERYGDFFVRLPLYYHSTFGVLGARQKRAVVISFVKHNVPPALRRNDDTFYIIPQHLALQCSFAYAYRHLWLLYLLAGSGKCSTIPHIPRTFSLWLWSHPQDEEIALWHSIRIRSKDSAIPLHSKDQQNRDVQWAS